jgi:hypothetical protein
MRDDETLLIRCDELDGSLGPVFPDRHEWREHVAPLIAARIACDPERAIEALRNTTYGENPHA